MRASAPFDGVNGTGFELAARLPRRRVRGAAAAIYLAAASLFAFAVVFPPAGYFYNPDELELSLSCLDRILGVPSVILMEPSSVLQFLFLPVAAADYVLRHGLPSGVLAVPGGVASYLAAGYMDPRHPVLLVRLIVLFLSALGPVFAFLIGYRISGNRAAGAFLAGCILLHPTYYERAATASGDSAAIAVALGSVLAAISAENRLHAAMTGAIFATAAAAKLTVLTLGILPLLLLTFGRELGLKERVARGLAFAGGCIAGFLFWCPYAWTEPLRFAKAVFGTVNKRGSAFDLTLFTEKWIACDGFVFAALLAGTAAVALVAFGRERNQPYLAATLITAVVIAIPLMMRATITYPRYYLPYLPCFVVAAACIARRFSGRLANPRLPALLAAGVLAGTGMETFARERALRGPDDLRDSAALLRRLPPDTRVYLPEEAVKFIGRDVPRQVYARMLARAEERLGSGAYTLRFMGLLRIPEDSGRVLINSFNEDEQAAAGHLAAIVYAAKADRRAIYTYYEPLKFQGLVAERTSFADMPLDDAIHQASSPGAAILLERPRPSLGKPVWSGSRRWHWYLTAPAAGQHARVGEH